MSSTRAGALRLNFWAILYNDSPGCTVYVRDVSTPSVVDEATVVAVLVVLADDLFEPLPDTIELNTASNAKTHVLHSK